MYKTIDQHAQTGYHAGVLAVANVTEINTNKKFRLVDGGVVANNPCIQAIAFASVFHGANIKDMAVLSLGTGQAVGRMNPATWGGYLPWIAGECNVCNDYVQC